MDFSAAKPHPRDPTEDSGILFHCLPMCVSKPSDALGLPLWKVQEHAALPIALQHHLGRGWGPARGNGTTWAPDRKWE